MFFSPAGLLLSLALASPIGRGVTRFSAREKVTRLDSYQTKEGEEDIRKAIERLVANTSNVLDLGCGTGLSTRVDGLGVDKSKEAIRIARLLHPKKRFVQDDAATFENGQSTFNAVTLIHVLQECGQEERMRILNNACRLSNHVIVVGPDPASRMVMNPFMFSGNEKQLNDYYTWIELDLAEIAFVHDRFSSTSHVGNTMITQLRDKSLLSRNRFA